MQIIVDKIASVNKNIGLKRKIEIGPKIIAKEGYVLVVEILNNKKFYNQLELTSGRQSTLQKGDIIVVALGNRKALKGFVGEVPEKLKVGDIINILNLGGVVGVCTSENFQEVGHALKARVLGAVLNEKGAHLNIKEFKLFDIAEKIKNKIPLIFVSGTCMNVGKTSVACEIIKSAIHKGYSISSAKVAGIAALRDTIGMRDHGAAQAVSIIDAGYTSTAIDKKIPAMITKGAVNYLGAQKPDFIVIELGDGVLGEYGVMEILKDQELRKNIKAHIGCANDPLGALKLFEICKKIGAPLNLISGPVTDNSVGVRFIEKNLGVSAINGLSNGGKIFEYLQKKA